MKINLSKQMIYLFILSIILFILVLIFAFAVLVPAGKEYRIKRTAVNKQKLELRQLENFNNEVADKLQQLHAKNRHIIKAFESKFNAKRFQKQYKTHFTSLNLAKRSKEDVEEDFSVYEVNTTSQMISPQSFYNFLDAINKSDWIIKINFPIDFKRDKEQIKSSFSMRVYRNLEDVNSTKGE